MGMIFSDPFAMPDLSSQPIDYVETPGPVITSNTSNWFDDMSNFITNFGYGINGIAGAVGNVAQGVSSATNTVQSALNTPGASVSSSQPAVQSGVGLAGLFSNPLILIAGIVVIVLLVKK